MQVVFNPDGPFDEICERAARDVQEYRQALQGEMNVHWKAWAGDQLDEMMNNPSVTSNYLVHSDAVKRLAAASLVAEYWPPNEIFASACLRLAFGDPEPTVRGAAIACLLNRVHPFIQDPVGSFEELLQFLRKLEPKIPVQVARDAKRAASGFSERANQRTKRLCEQLAGPHLSEMLTGRTATELYLNHPDSNLRRAAVLVLYTHWKSTSDLRSICKRLIREDCDTNVRTQAQDVLAGAYAGTDDAEIGQLLARVVSDESQPVDLRQHAYASLSVVRGMPARRWLDVVSREFRFPEDVDWSFVDSFFHAAR